MARIAYTHIEYLNFHKYFQWSEPKLELATLPQNILLMNHEPSIGDYRHYFDLFEVDVDDYYWGRIVVLSKFCGSALDSKSLQDWRFYFERIVDIENISRKKRLDFFIGGLTGMAFQHARRYIHGNNEYMFYPMVYNKPYEEVVEYMALRFP